MYIVKSKQKVELAQKDFFTGLPFWNGLEKDEQTVVERETLGLMEEMKGQVTSRLKMGAHLLTLRDVLKSKFRPYIIDNLNFHWRTGYRYMQLAEFFRNGGGVSEPVVELAAAKGVDLVGFTVARPFGPYTEAVKKLGPAPKDPAKAGVWIEAVEAERQASPRKGRRKAPAPPEARMVRAFRAAVAEYKGVGGSGKSRWAVKLVGILMAEFGLPKGSVAPEAVPEGYRAVLGRPKTIDAELAG